MFKEYNAIFNVCLDISEGKCKQRQRNRIIILFHEMFFLFVHLLKTWNKKNKNKMEKEFFFDTENFQYPYRDVAI